MEIKSIKTAAQINKETRHARVINTFKELSENYPQYSPSRIAGVIAKRELKQENGIKTLMGVITILKRYNLWFPRPLCRAK